jgi:hypothetical protein
VSGYEGLAKQSIPLPMGGGLDESAHDYVVDAPALTLATNVRYDDRGAVAKRSGSSVMTSSGGPGAIIEASAIYEHLGALGIWHPDGFYKYDGQRSAWASTNECAPRPSRVRTDPLVRGNRSWQRSDCAIIGNVLCVVMEDVTEHEVWYAFYDVTNLTVLSGPTLYATGSNIRRNPRVLALGTRFVLFGVSGTSGAGSVYIASYDTAGGTYQFGSSTLTVGTGDFYDVCTEVGSSTFGMITRSGASDTRFSIGTYSGVSASQIAANFHGYAVCWNTFNNTLVAVGQVPAGAWGALAYVDDACSGAPTVTAAIYTATANMNFTRATICRLGASGSMFAAISGEGNVRSFTVDEACTDIIEISASYTANRSGRVPTTAIVGKAVSIYDTHSSMSDVLLPIADQVGISMSSSSSTSSPYNAAPYGVMVRPEVNAAGDYDVAIVARFLQDKIDKTDDTFHVSNVISASPDGTPEFWMTAPVLIDAAPVYSRANFERKGIDLVRARIDRVPAARSVTAQSLRLLGAGAGNVCFDGQQLAENSPPVVSFVAQHTNTTYEDPSASFPASSSTPAQPHRLKFVHRWVDAQGNIHRGAPSGEFQISESALTAVGGTAYYAPRIAISKASPSALNADRATRMEVEVYSAEYPSGEFHLIGVCEPYVSPTCPALWCVNMRWGAAVSFPATKSCFYLVAYTALSAFPTAYFEDELDNDQPPPLLDICSTQNRLWGLSAENRLELWPSKPIQVGRAPEWSASLVQQIPHEGGECVGIAALDDVVVIFKERQTYAVFGDPGDAAGEGSTLQKPRLLSAVVGCVNANSIVEGPFGIVFQSDRGFYLITPGRQMQFIGERVKGSSASMVVTSGTLVPSQSEVRWTLDANGYDFSSQKALVWNFQHDAWAYWTGFAAVHACIYQGEYARLLTSSFVRLETPETYSSDASNAMIVRTPWIKLAGLAGYKRLWRTIFLGRYFSGGLQISYEIDYVVGGSSSTTRSWTGTEMVAASQRSDLVDGGVTTTAYRLELGVRQTPQKIQAIRFTLTEDATGSQLAPETAGRGFELVGLQVEVGVLRGAYKRLIAGAKK